MKFDKKITFIYNSAYKGERYTINNKLDFKDPNNHITYYEISDNQEQIIVHFKSGKSFSYPYSKEREKNILNMMKEQIDYLKEEKSRLKNKREYYGKVAKAFLGAFIPINFTLISGPLLSYFINQDSFISDLILLFVFSNGMIFAVEYIMNQVKKECETKLERIELLEDIMDPELLKEKEYSKTNILVNTSNRMKKSQSTKIDYTKNELINEMSRLSLDLKNLKDLRTMVENIQYTNMLSKDKEKTYIKK